MLGGRLQSDPVLGLQILGKQQCGPPSGPTVLQCPTNTAIQIFEIGRMHPLSVRWIQHHKTGFGIAWWPQIQEIRHFDTHQMLESCPAHAFTGITHGMLVPIRSQDRCPFDAFLTGLLTHRLPESGIKTGQAEQGPLPPAGMNRDARGPQPGLHGKGARPTHRVDQGLPGTPSGEPEQSRRQHLVEWSTGLGCTITPLEQGILSYKVEGNGHLISGNVQVDELLRRGAVDVEVVDGAALGLRAEMIAQGILEPEHGKPIVREMLTVHRHIEGQ